MMSEPEVYNMEPHAPKQLKGLPWKYCRYCGLVYLRNDISTTCIRLGCNYSLHPDYQRWRLSCRRGKI